VRTTLVLGGFCAALALLAAPYVAHLHHHTGRWELTAKTQDISLETWRDVAERDRAARDAAFFALDETGLQLESDRSTLPALVRSDPTGYLAIVGINLRTLLTEGLLRWALLPIPAVLLAAWGAWSTRDDRATHVVLAMAAVGLVTPIAFFVLPRYLIPVAALMIALAGVGGAHLSRRWRTPVVAIVGISLIVALLGGLGFPSSLGAPREPTEHRIVGEWLHANAPFGSSVMTRNQVTEHYSELTLVPLPAAPQDEVLRFARHYGVDYLVVDEYRLRYLRPELDRLFEPGPWPGLRLVHTTEVDGRLTRVFVLDPAPQGDTADPPTDASFVADQRG